MNQPINEANMTTPAGVDTRRILLREVGDQAAVRAQRQAADTEALSAPTALEDAAHAAGISWQDIDRARVAGVQARSEWGDIRDAPDLDEAIRDYLRIVAHVEARLLHDMVAVDALVDQRRLLSGELVTAEQVLEIQQHERNLSAVYSTLNTFCAMAELTDEEATKIRGRLDNWPSAISGAVMIERETGESLSEEWQFYAQPWIEDVRNRIAVSLRHQPSAETEPLLPSLDTIRTQARHAARAHLNHDQQQISSTPITPAISVADAVTASLPTLEATNPSTVLFDESVMSQPADFVVLHPDGTAVYGTRDPNSGLSSSIREHVLDLSVQGIGQVRAWFTDNFSAPNLRQNPLADRMLARLGYQHPTGWYGPVALTMEEDRNGHIPPLSNHVRDLAAELTDTPMRQAGPSTADSIRAATPTVPDRSSSTTLGDGASTFRPSAAGRAPDAGVGL